MYQIRVLSGSRAGAVLPLVSGQTFVVGRGAEANLSVPDDPTLSRNHADLVLEGSQVVLRNRSQHGSLVGGQVIQGNAPVAVGQEFQVGGTRLVIEMAAGGAALPPTPPPMPAGGGGPPPVPQPIGGPIGGEPTPAPGTVAAVGGGKDAGGTGKDAAAAGMAAAKAFAAGGGGPVKIDHTGPGFPAMACISGGLNIVKANLIPSFFLAVPMLLVGIIMAVGVFMSAVPSVASKLPLGLVMSILGALAGLSGLAAPMLVANYMAGIKEFQHSGTRIAVGQLFKFDNIVQRYLTMFAVGVSAICCGLPPLVLHWAVPIIVDKPHVGFVNALKASVKFGTKAIVPTLIMFIILGVVNTIASYCCALVLLVTGPMGIAAQWLAYELKRDEIVAAAAEGGITL